MTEIKEASANKFRMSEGDWVCSDSNCRNVNFARRNKCNRCNKERLEGIAKKKLGQEIGKALADKSRGLFSADDWQCNKCGNVNWARRQQCNMCNAPKFGEVEERTGYGGGYNDRGVVEYIKRDDSDNEYDEFGRKRKNKTSVIDGENEEEENDEDFRKKKKIKPDDQDLNDTTINRENNSSARVDDDKEDEEEDEDEGENDDDLSKYDLSGWGDVSDDHKALDSSEAASDNDNSQTLRSDRPGPSRVNH